MLATGWLSAVIVTVTLVDLVQGEGANQGCCLVRSLSSDAHFYMQSFIHLALQVSGCAPGRCLKLSLDIPCC